MDTAPFEQVTAKQAALGAIRAYCGWHVAPKVTEELICDGEGRPALQLPTGHVSEVHKVEIKTGAEWSDVTGKVDWSAAGVLVFPRRGGCAGPEAVFPDRPRSVRVSLTHGYTAEEVPQIASVLSAVSERAAVSALRPTRQRAGPFTVEYGQRADGSNLAGLALMAHERAILRPYKLIWGP